MTSGIGDVWQGGATYERYVGTWSRLVAREFLTWLRIGTERRWLDVGCGTGILARAVLELADLTAVVGVDPSDGFLAGSDPSDRHT